VGDVVDDHRFPRGQRGPARARAGGIGVGNVVEELRGEPVLAHQPQRPGARAVGLQAVGVGVGDAGGDQDGIQDDRPVRHDQEVRPHQRPRIDPQLAAHAGQHQPPRDPDLDVDQQLLGDRGRAAQPGGRGDDQDVGPEQLVVQRWPLVTVAHVGQHSRRHAPVHDPDHVHADTLVTQPSGHPHALLPTRACTQSVPSQVA
jgi:hypothetical protein